MGIPWIGSGAAGNACMLVREVSVVVDMMIHWDQGVWGRLYSKRTVERPQEEIQLINVL